MKIRICFLAMMLGPLIYYGVIQMAPAGQAATVSASFHQLGKAALGRIESAQEAVSESDDAFNQSAAQADQAMAIAKGAAHTAADQRDYSRLVNYLYDVKQDHMLVIAATDPSQSPDSEQTNAARHAAESAFQ